MRGVSACQHTDLQLFDCAFCMISSNWDFISIGFSRTEKSHDKIINLPVQYPVIIGFYEEVFK